MVVQGVLETGRTSLEDCIARCGQGQTTEIPLEGEVYFSRVRDLQYPWLWQSPNKPSYSQNFQWLPCVVDISGEHSQYVDNLGSGHVTYLIASFLQDHQLYQQPTSSQVQRSLCAHRTYNRRCHSAIEYDTRTSGVCYLA